MHSWWYTERQRTDFFSEIDAQFGTNDLQRASFEPSFVQNKTNKQANKKKKKKKTNKQKKKKKKKKKNVPDQAGKSQTTWWPQFEDPTGDNMYRCSNYTA